MEFFSDNIKPIIEDKEFLSDIREQNFERKVLRKIYAVKKTFIDVKFGKSEISQCYFRNCRFIRCDFTGANISKCNFRGSQYEDCKFHYTHWEHTLLDDDFLDNCLPSEENLARDLVRTLRVNFGQVGNYPAVNKAASIEVELTGKHLFNAAYSRQSYYRSKYKGWNRVTHALSHLQWKLLDILWGNGESILRVLICGVSIIFTWSAFLAWQSPQFSWPASFGTVMQAFWGIQTHPPIPEAQLAMLSALRFLLVGLFMAILIKRLARR